MTLGMTKGELLTDNMFTYDVGKPHQIDKRYYPLEHDQMNIYFDNFSGKIFWNLLKQYEKYYEK